jgi:hypothetical protein
MRPKLIYRQPPTSPLLHKKCHNQVAPVVSSLPIERRKKKKIVTHETNGAEEIIYSHPKKRRRNKVFFSATNKPPTPYNTHWSAPTLLFV